MTDQELMVRAGLLLSRCSLNEALLWVWDERVPVLECLQGEKCLRQFARLGMRTP